jgi:hypothetical protein
MLLRPPRRRTGGPRGGAGGPRLAPGVPADEAERGDALRHVLEQRPVVRGSAVDGELRDPLSPVGHRHARAPLRGLLARLGAEHEPVALDEEDPRPGIARALVQREDDLAEDVVRVAPAPEDAVDLRACIGRCHSSTSPPSNRATASRTSSGTGRAFRSARST